MTNKTTKPDKPWLLWLMWAEVTILLLLWFYFMGPTIFWNLVTVATLPDKCASTDIADIAKCNEITRNFGWMLWMLLSATGVGFGLWLTWQGRQIQRDQWKTQDKQWKTQHTSHLQERFEKATEMLGSEIELVRIGGCRSLMNLSINEASMKNACVSLLFDFISNPPLSADEKGKSLDDRFPADKSLRPDIESAISSFSAVYEYYGERDIYVDADVSKLPKYFWQNEKKGVISLRKANLQLVHLYGAKLNQARLAKANLSNVNLRCSELQEVNLHEANLDGTELYFANLNMAHLWRANLIWVFLWGADLSMAHLEDACLFNARLQGADLRGANFLNARLNGADISDANMQAAENLTKEQILSAKWINWGDEIKEWIKDAIGETINDVPEWGHGRTSEWIALGDRKFSGPPQLSPDLERDEDIQAWLKKDHSNDR